MEKGTSVYVIKDFEVNPYVGFAEPLFETEDGEYVIIVARDQVVMYNTKDDSVLRILGRTYTECISAVTYFESLVSPQGYYLCDKQHKKILAIFYD